jgi:hypothetical protein
MTAYSVDSDRADAPFNLEALGLDLPFFRWYQARQYIRSERERALVGVRCDMIEILFCAKVRQQARRRVRAADVSCVASPFDSLPTADEIADERRWAQSTFGKSGTL